VHNLRRTGRDMRIHMCEELLFSWRSLLVYRAPSSPPNPEARARAGCKGFVARRRSEC
jgi:hypothetical protein